MLVRGLGPVELAACMLAKALGANKVIGIDTVEERCKVRRTYNLCMYVCVYIYIHICIYLIK